MSGLSVGGGEILADSVVHSLSSVIRDPRYANVSTCYTDIGEERGEASEHSVPSEVK